MKTHTHKKTLEDILAMTRQRLLPLITRTNRLWAVYVRACVPTCCRVHEREGESRGAKRLPVILAAYNKKGNGMKKMLGDRMKRSFNVKPINAVGRADGQTRDCGMGQLRNPSSVHHVFAFFIQLCTSKFHSFNCGSSFSQLPGCWYEAVLLSWRLICCLPK